MQCVAFVTRHLYSALIVISRWLYIIINYKVRNCLKLSEKTSSLSRRKSSVVAPEKSEDIGIVSDHETDDECDEGEVYSSYGVRWGRIGDGRVRKGKVIEGCGTVGLEK